MKSDETIKFKMAVVSSVLLLVFMVSTIRICCCCSSTRPWKVLRNQAITENANINLCPKTPCRCSAIRQLSDEHSGITADCTMLNLTSIPHNLSPHTIQLYLRENKILTLQNDDLTPYPQLRLLDLSFNNLKTLEPKSFNSAANLEELFLNSNSLSTTDVSMPLAVFDELKSLLVLKLHNNLGNEMTPKPTRYRDDLFLKLTKLRKLTIDGVQDAELGAGFSHLFNLTDLEIYKDLNVVKNTTFRYLTGLPITRLNIKTGSNLLSLEPESFAHFHRLLVLDLSYNTGLDLIKVSRAWYGLLNTSITTLILTRIIPNNMQSTDILSDFYTYLNLTKIEHLYLDKNNIVNTAPGLCTNLHITHLDMSYNRLSNVASYILDLAKMKKVRFIDASHQIKRFITKREAPVNTSRQREHNNNNSKNIRALNKRFVSTADDSSCKDVSSNLTLCSWPAVNSSGSYPLPDRGPWCFIVSPKLEIYNLSASLNVDLQYMPQIIALGGNHLKEIVYKNNGISVWVNPFVIGNPNPNVPMTLDASENGLMCFSPNVLMWNIIRGGWVGKLIFSKNNLYEQLEHDITGDVFKYYQRLIELHLDENGIKTLPKLIFQNLSAIEILNLSGNSLRLLNFQLSHLRHLQLIDVSNNLITNIDSETLRRLEKNINEFNMSLNLYGNPLQCSCDTFSFLQWMHKHQRHLFGFNSYSCMYGKNADALFSTLEEKILPELSFMCSTRVALYVAAGLLAFAIIFLAVSVFAYRHRWDIKYYLLHLHIGTKELVESEEARRQYDYDAFIIYDHRDIKWVRNELETRLGLPGGRSSRHNSGTAEDNVQEDENQNGVVTEREDHYDRFRFCIHQRDFEAGDTIHANILQSMERSRKHILVISPHLLDSNWCQFEMDVAISQRVLRGFNTIIPIMLHPVNDMKSMPSYLQDIIRSMNYIEWPAGDYSEDVERFWKQLYNSIKLNA